MSVVQEWKQKWIATDKRREAAEAERDTARARVKDLEGELAIAWEDDPALTALQAKVARAVALLERAAKTENDVASKRLASEALEALR